MKVLLAAGGTGGHVYPALVLADELRDRGHEVAFAGGDRVEAKLVPAAGYELHRLPGRYLPRWASWDVFRAPPALARATVKARALLRRLAPEVVVGMGNYGAVAPCWAARMRRTPVVLHEQNAMLSLSNRMCVTAARVVALSLPLARQPRLRVRSVLTGNPVRRALRTLPSRAEAAARLGLDPSRTTLLVFGGSQGAAALNQSVPEALSGTGIQVLHLTGPGGTAEWHGADAVVLEYLDAMQDAYACADLVVCRSGASTVAELTATGRPSVLVPLPYRRDPLADAQALSGAGAAEIVMQGPELVSRLREVAGGLLEDAGRREAMARAARGMGHPDAAERLADLVESAARD